MKNTLLASLLIALMPLTVQAGDLYVSTTGSGDVCSKTVPCGSIQKAIDKAASGDVVHVAAGTYVENIRIGAPGAPKPGITISGEDAENTILISAGTNTMRPGPADVIVDIWSPNTVIQNLTIKHPKGEPPARDVGIFVGPPAHDSVIRKSVIVRKRFGLLEPSSPGSRGILVFKAKGVVIAHNRFKGNYEDHIHIPAAETVIIGNRVSGATRLGIVIIKESPTSVNNKNLVAWNNVSKSGNDGIQIQGSDNMVMKNKARNNGGAAIKLCGEPDTDPDTGDGDCVAPFDRWAHATGNRVFRNKTSGNAVNGVVDNGTGNIVK